MQSEILRRIAAKSSAPRLLDALCEELSPGDLQSLLVAVFRARTEGLRASDILERWERSPLVRPSNVDARLLNEFDRIAFDAAKTFEAVDLSPVCPVGAQTLLGNVGQDNVLTAIRNCEALGDSTPALALECARRRKRPSDRKTAGVLRLASSHRVMRLQPFDFPGYRPHFRLFGLVSAGRDTGSNGFELEQFRAHTDFYLRLFRRLNEAQFHLSEPLVEFSDVSITETLLAAAGVSSGEVREAVRAHRPGSSERFLAARAVTLPGAIANPEAELADTARTHGFESRLFLLSLLYKNIVRPLEADYPEASFRFNLARLEGLGYYAGLCLRISPAAPNGIRYPVVDGGLTDWTQRLLQDRKERLLISGIGTEFVCSRYRAAHAAS